MYKTDRNAIALKNLINNDLQVDHISMIVLPSCKKWWQPNIQFLQVVEKEPFLVNILDKVIRNFNLFGQVPGIWFKHVHKSIEVILEKN